MEKKPPSIKSRKGMTFKTWEDFTEDHIKMDHRDMLDKLMQDSRDRINYQIEEEIKRRLNVIGIDFKSNEDFYQFCRERLTKLNRSPENESYLYLDYGKPDELLIATFFDKYEFKQIDNKFLITWNALS